MEKALKLSHPLEDRIISSTVKLVSDKIKQNIGNFPRGVCLSGLETSKLHSVAIGLSRKLQQEGIGVYTERVNGAEEMDISDYYLQGLARVYSQRFRSKWNDKKSLIVVEGTYSDNMEKFMNHLRNRVDVFVETKNQCPYNEDVFTVFFNGL